jgi:hypothetical protein
MYNEVAGADKILSAPFVFHAGRKVADEIETRMAADTFFFFALLCSLCASAVFLFFVLGCSPSDFTCAKSINTPAGGYL